MTGSNALWVGHRGFPAQYPENTIPSLTAALQQGAAGVEFDLQVTRDGVPVVLHDESLQRTAGVQRLVSDLTLSELNGISVHEPDRFGDRFLGTPIAALEQVVTELEQFPDAYVFAEIKCEVFRTMEPALFAESVARTLRRLPRAVIISFDLEVLRLCQSRFDLPVGWVLTRYDEPSLAQVQQRPVDYLVCNYEKFPPSSTQFWQGPWKWFAYDVTDATVYYQCKARGVTFFETWDVGAMIAQDMRGE